MEEEKNILEDQKVEEINEETVEETGTLIDGEILLTPEMEEELSNNNGGEE